MENSFIKFLKYRLQNGDLPGRPAQVEMAPEPVDRENPRRAMDAPSHARSSSVLVLFFPNSENELELILTLRTSDINHGGQLSFPGGRSEKGESEIETALREAEEEIGITPADIEIVGLLSKLYVPHSNSHVTPVVGYLDCSPSLSINPAEVEEAFSVELESLAGKENLTVENWELRQQSTYKVPYWDVHRVPLWGATAMMLNELLDIYRSFKSEVDNDSV